MAVKRVNHFVIAEIFRGAVRVNHQVNAVINSQIGFIVNYKIPVVTVQRVGAPDFSMNTPFNKAPNFVRSRVVDKTTAQPENTPRADQPGNKTHGEVTDMDIKDIKTVDDLRKACPDMVAKIETEAINAERTRIQEIENATLPGAEDEANEAKFVKPIDSASFAKAVIASMKAKQQKQSKDYLDKAKANAQTSGANNITNPPPANPEPEKAQEKGLMNAIRKMNGVK